MNPARLLALLAFVVALPGGAAARDPKPDKDPTLTAFLKAAPLTAREDDLRALGAGEGRELPLELIVDRNEIRYGADGRATSMRQIVMRYRTREAVEGLGTFDVPYAPWFEDRPVVRGRVIPARGGAIELDPRTIAESAAKNPQLIVSDRKNLAVPLPHLAPGATVELVMVKTEHRPPYGAAVRNGFHPIMAGARATIVHVEAPRALGLELSARAIDASVSKRDTGDEVVRHVEIHDAPPRFARVDEPRGIAWSIGQGGWAALAARYAETIAPVLAGPTGWPVATGTRRDKVGAVLGRVARELRYTGLHLGDAAIVPFSPQETLARGYGDCKDLAVLVVSALAEAGVEAHVALLRAGDPLMVDERMPGLDLFDHAIVYVPAAEGAPALWLDATTPEFGVGSLPTSDLGRNALLIAPDTRGLTPTPARGSPESTDLYHVEVVYRPEPIGPGRATLTYTFGGEERYKARRQYGGQDRRPLEEFTRQVARGFDGRVVETRVGGLDDAVDPVTLSFELVDVGRLDSDGRTQRVVIDMEPAMDRLGHGLFEADRRFPFTMPRAVDLAIRYRVVPPRGYRVADKPSDAEIAFGPLRWKASFVEGADGTLEVFGRYEVPTRALEPSEVAEVLDQADRRDAVRDYRVELVPDQAKLAPLERAAWFRKEVAARPDDAELRARWALELDKWGLSEAARKEADRAAARAAGSPSERFVLIARARLWERDTFGRVYRRGWDRKRAIAAWRAVLALDPKSTWARHELADILVRDEAGELAKKRTKEGDEGRALLIATAREGSEHGLKRALESLDEIGRHAEIIALCASWQGPSYEFIDGAWARAVALAEGPDAAAALIESWGEPHRIGAGLVRVTTTFMMARRFGDASRVFDALSDALGGAQNPIAEWSGKVEKLSPMNDFSTPDKALRSLYSLLATDPEDLDERIAKLSGGVADAREAARLRELLAPRGVAELLGDGAEARWALYDLIFGLATLKTEGDDAIGWQTTIAMPVMGRPGQEPREIGKAYFAPGADKRALRLVGFAGEAAVPMEALAMLRRGDVGGARRWLAWAWAGARMTPKTLSEPGDETSVEELWRMAFLLAVTGESGRAEALIAGLEVGADHLVGAERGLVLERLASWSRTPEARDKALAVMHDLFVQRAPSPDERAIKARLLALQGRKDEALALAAERLAGDPSDARLVAEMANIESIVGELSAARNRLAGLRETGRLDDSGHNEIAWLDLCLGTVDADSLESARRAAKRGNMAAVHTRAMVEVERGLLDDGAESARRLVGDDDHVSPSVWLVTGRMAEALGLNELAIRYYGEVTGEGEIAGPTSSEAVAKARMARLR